MTDRDDKARGVLVRHAREIDALKAKIKILDDRTLLIEREAHSSIVELVARHAVKLRVCEHEPLEDAPGSEFTLGFFRLARCCKHCGLVYVPLVERERIEAEAKTRRSAADRLGLPPAEDPMWDDPEGPGEDGTNDGVVDVEAKADRVLADYRALAASDLCDHCGHTRDVHGIGELTSECDSCSCDSFVEREVRS